MKEEVTAKDPWRCIRVANKILKAALSLTFNWTLRCKVCACLADQHIEIKSTAEGRLTSPWQVEEKHEASFPEWHFGPWLLGTSPLIYMHALQVRGFPGGSDSKEFACSEGDLGLIPLGWEDALEKGKATNSRILAWRIPWTQEAGGLQSMGSQKIGHDWATVHALLILIIRCVI